MLSIAYPQVQEGMPQVPTKQNPIKRQPQTTTTREIQLATLQMVLRAFSFARFFDLEGGSFGWYFDIECSFCGGGVSVDCMWLLMVDIVDEVVRRHRTIRPCLCIDDLTLTAMERPYVVAELVTGAVGFTIHLMEDKFKLFVPRCTEAFRDGNSVVTASSKGVQKAPEAHL